MKNLLFVNARLINPEADSDEMGWLLVRDGCIADTGHDAPPTPENTETVDCGGQCLAPGLVDWGVKVGEPGERHKESYASAGLAAARGGVTTMVVRPDTDPVIDTPEVLEFVTRRAQAESLVNVVPIAALTKGFLGKEMTEIGFLMDAGAVAFSDCTSVMRNAKVFSRALAYARSCGALVIGHPQDPTLSAGAAVTSGKFASLRGLPAVSPMAERMGLDRDIALIEMTGARYHADIISTNRALPSLSRAKANGFDVTAGTDIHHLTLNELDVADYRSFFKFRPPLRAEEDRQALIEAVRDGLIDTIGSFHTPQDEESKRLPFEEAASGAVGLETLLPAALRLHHGEGLSLPTLFRAMSLNPARRLGLAAGRLSVGAPADLIVFNPNTPFVLDRFALASKSKNTPFDGQRLQGRVVASYVGGHEIYRKT
jgi:dihydroorotase